MGMRSLLLFLLGSLFLELDRDRWRMHDAWLMADDNTRGIFSQI